MVACCTYVQYSSSGPFARTRVCTCTATATTVLVCAVAATAAVCATTAAADCRGGSNSIMRSSSNSSSACSSSSSSDRHLPPCSCEIPAWHLRLISMRASTAGDTQPGSAKTQITIMSYCRVGCNSCLLSHRIIARLDIRKAALLCQTWKRSRHSLPCPRRRRVALRVSSCAIARWLKRQLLHPIRQQLVVVIWVLADHVQDEGCR